MKEMYGYEWTEAEFHFVLIPSLQVNFTISSLHYADYLLNQCWVVLLTSA